MEILRQGGGSEVGKLGDDPQTKFFVLGLSPNAARLSVRFWHVATLGQMVDKLKAHYDALRLRGSFERDPEFPAAWQLLDQTAPRRAGKTDRDKIPPILAGPLLRSILTGSRYPQGLFSAVLNRIRADHEVSYLRACIFKAFLTRNHQQDIPMSLDTNRTESAYLLGRLFAALEKTQEDALPGINASIRDRFYSAASATPGSVFPRLLRTYQHHLSKATSEGGQGYKVNRERLVQEIMGKLQGMPAHLALEGQGLFAIGYYHQRQDFFTKKDKPESPQA
jgi:CRISPR-associated protein Csd1